MRLLGEMVLSIQELTILLSESLGLYCMSRIAFASFKGVWCCQALDILS